MNADCLTLNDSAQIDFLLNSAQGDNSETFSNQFDLDASLTNLLLLNIMQCNYDNLTDVSRQEIVLLHCSFCILILDPYKKNSKT